MTMIGPACFLCIQYFRIFVKVKKFRFRQLWRWQSCSSTRDGSCPSSPPPSSSSAAMPSLGYILPLLLPFLLPLVPHEVGEEKGVFVRVCQVADRLLRNRPVHLNLDALHGEVAVERRPLHVAGLARVLVLFQVRF